MRSTSRLVFTLLVSAACVLGSAVATAQDYPSKPIRFIVPYAAGATLDVVARIVGAGMSKILGQPIVIENKPGADAIIGFEYVAKQVAADGYTIMIAAVSGLATLPLTVKELRFDPLKDLPPVMGLVEGKYVFGIPSKLRANTFNELVAYAKANPGKLNYGASSTTVRLQTAALIRDLGLDVVYVPYRGGAAYIQALATGEIQIGFVAEGSAITMGERFRALAVTGSQRTDAFRDAPTFAELGLSSMRGVSYSLNVRAGIPKIAFDKLHAAASQTLQQPELKAQFAKMGLEVTAQPPEAAARRLAEEAKFFADVAKKAGIQPE